MRHCRNIWKRKDGRWEGRYKITPETELSKSKYRSVYGRTFTEVKQKLDDAVARQKEPETDKTDRLNHKIMQTSFMRSRSRS